MNSIGILFRFSTYGESHGVGIGGIIDGVPSGLYIDTDFIESQIIRRKGGGKFATPRKEEDRFEIHSGVFEGYSTGAPIGFFIPNSNVRSKDYDKEILRPSHADFTYHHKYGIRDYRGGGRSSARESVARVFGGSIAKLLLREFDVEILSGIIGIGGVISNRESFSKEDFLKAGQSDIFALDLELEEEQKKELLEAKHSGDSIGATAMIVVKNMPLSLGEPLYYRLDQVLCGNLMGLNAVKAVQIGSGVESSRKRGSQINDSMSKEGFLSNHSGGILGGISNGEDIVIKVHFKPTPSIFLEQKSIDIHGNERMIKLQGRHDPCVGVRGSIVCESIVAMVLADMLMLNATSRLDSLKRTYKHHT